MNIPLMTRSGLEASQCGHRFNSLYNLGMEDDSPFSLRGTAVHTWKKLYIKGLMVRQVPADYGIAKWAFEEAIRHEKTPPQLVPEVWNIVSRHAQNFALDLEHFIAVEDRRQRVDADLPYQYEPDLEYAFPTYIETIDTKTYYVAMTEAQVRDNFQTHFYIWAAMQEYPNYEVFRFTYDFVRLNVMVSVEFTRTEHEAAFDAEVRAWEAGRRQRYIDNDWTAQAGDVCGFCNLACPLTDDPARAYIRVKSDADKQKNGQLIIVLEKELKARKKAQKASVTKDGPIDVHGEVFAFRTHDKVSYPGNVVVDTVRQLGEEPGFRVSKSALKWLFAHVPHLDTDLAPHAIVKTQPRFGHKSVKQDLRHPQVDFDDPDGDHGEDE